MVRNRSLLLGLLGAAHSLNHSYFWILPLLLPLNNGAIVRELETSGSAISIVATISYMIYGGGALVGGALSDRLGELKVIKISLALSGFSTFLFLITHNIISFGVGLILMAIWASLYHPTANSLISKAFQRDIAEAMGIHGIGSNIGYMFTPLIAVAFGILFGWRSPFVFFGILSICVALLFSISPLLPTQTTVTRTKGGFWNVFKVSGLWPLFIYSILVGLYFRGVNFYIPTFLVEERKVFSIELAGLAATFLIALGVLGQWICGKASDLFGSKKVLVATSFGVTLSLLSLQLIYPPIIGVSFFIILFGLFFYGHQPARNSLTGLIAPGNVKGAAFGVLFFFTFGLGSISTAITYFFSEIFGWEFAFYVLTLFSAIALLLSFLTSSKNRHRLTIAR